MILESVIFFALLLVTTMLVALLPAHHQRAHVGDHAGLPDRAGRAGAASSWPSSTTDPG